MVRVVRLRDRVVIVLVCSVVAWIAACQCRADTSTSAPAGPPAPSDLSCEFLLSPSSTVIYDPQPEFAWTCGAAGHAYTQAAYQIQVQRAGLPLDETPLWDSGRVASDSSVNVEYAGAGLEPGTRCVWRVRAWDLRGSVSSWSHPQEFRLASRLSTNQTSRYLVAESADAPAVVREVGDGNIFVDYGKAAFGYLKLYFPEPAHEETTLRVRFGEKLLDGKIDQKPGGSIRHYLVKIALPKGARELAIHPPRDKRNTSGAAVRLPKEFGTVAPFRYVEVSGLPGAMRADQVERIRIEYPFDEGASYFESSDETLNAIWDLCKYSIRATTFCGVYVDGDRERIPYEADAYINQLSHYSVDREYALARHSHEYLMKHPTWPTEWHQQSIFMAWEDFMYTGNTESLSVYYEQLKREKLLSHAMNPDGLLDTSDKQFRDIVDWPPSERDAHEMRPVNTVVNAFHYATLIRMAGIADALGKPGESEQFRKEAGTFKATFNRILWDDSRKCYVDGEGSQHSSVQSNLFPLAFDLVPPEQVAHVADFLKERGMRCSVYAAQFLLDGLYQNGQSDLGLQFLTSKQKRSWYNMIRQGSTITLEAWDKTNKTNLDWNHAWGAAPANLIPRQVVGVRPLEPGFRKILVHPQPASLQSFSSRVPTIRGPVSVEYATTESGYELQVTVPGNATARVGLPGRADDRLGRVSHNGIAITPRVDGQRPWIDAVPPGTHTFDVAVERSSSEETGVAVGAAP